MSYCTMATCTPHHRAVYFDLEERIWVHHDGWPCEPMAAVPAPASWPDY